MFNFIYSTLILTFISLMPNAMHAQELGTSTTKGWETNLQNDFQKHGILLNQLIAGSAQNVPDVQLNDIKQNLASNANDLATLFASFFDQKAGLQFKSLFETHIKLGGDYINAVKMHQPTDKIVDLSNQNGKDLAALFTKWFSNIPNAEWQKMWLDHISLEKQVTDAYFQNNIPLGTQLSNAALAQLKQLGDLIIKGAKTK